MSTYFISDLHLGHESLSKHRGFDNAEQMWQLIKTNWNSVVKKHDKVFILGDISMESAKFYHLLVELKGTKEVILGNHDKPKHVEELLKYVDKVSGLQKYKQKGFPTVWLSHAPVHESELLNKECFNFHGHVHEKSLDDPRYFNFSCEAVNYTPVLYQDLMFKLNTCKIVDIMGYQDSSEFEIYYTGIYNYHYIMQELFGEAYRVKGHVVDNNYKVQSKMNCVTLR